MTTKNDNLGRLLVLREIARGRGRELAAAADKHSPPGAIDRLAALAPGWRTNRQLARMENTILAGGYDVTQASRTRRGRANRGAEGAADKAQDVRTLWELRETCRDHDRNSALLHGLIDRAAENIAGPEFLFAPNSGDAGFDAEATAMLAEFAPTAEYRGMFNFQELIYGSTRALWPDGDLLFNFVAAGRLQVIEAHQLVTPLHGKGYRARAVVGGVELDDQLTPQAYYLRDPRQAGSGAGGWITDWRQAQRLPAADVTHVANRDRFSQTRGTPVLAPLLDMFERLDGYLDSEMIAAELASHRVTYIKRTGAEELPGVQNYSDVNQTGDSVKTFEKLLRSEPGLWLDLNLNEDIGTTGGDRPTESFQPYIMTVLRMLGACVGQPLELILLDFSQTNYSSARAALLQAYRSFRRRQNQTRDRIIQPIYNRLIGRQLAGGRLKLIKDVYHLEFTPPRWAWVDPLKEVLALEKEVAAGAKSLTEWIGETGRVAEAVFNTRAAELVLLQKLGVPTSTVAV